MITEYKTCVFSELDNCENKNQVDELFDLANKDIRYARNKLCKIQRKVLNLSQDPFEQRTTEEKEILELLSTMHQATLIRELKEVVDRLKYMIASLQKHQRNRLEKLDDIFENITSQIVKKRKERENSDDKHSNLNAQICYSIEMHKLKDLKFELLRMKEKS